MALTSLVAGDSFLLDDYPVDLEFANGDVVTIEYPNDLVTRTPGKNGNTIYAYIAGGDNVDVTFKLMRGGSADKFINGKLSQMIRNFGDFVPMNGAFVKRLNQDGKVVYDNTSLGGLVFKKKPGVKSNVDGDGEQGTITYEFYGVNGTRGLL